LKDAREGIDTAKDRISDKYAEAAKTAVEKEEEISGKIRERPLEWVAGAFIAGMVISKLLSRKD